MRHRVASTIALALALSGLGAGIALSGSASSAATRAGVHPHAVQHRSTFVVNVSAKHPWTYTNIYVSQGQQVKIQASGTIHVGQGVSAGPVGKTFDSSRCGYDAYRSSYTFLAPGVNCWGMVFAVGSSYAAFPTGSSITFVSPVSDYLQLGVNDNFFNDNTGAFTARVSL